MMDNSINPLYAQGKNPWILVIALLGITIGGIFLIGQVLAFVAAIMISGLSLTELMNVLANPTAYPEQRMMILIVQGVSSVGGFVIAPLIFYYTLVGNHIFRDFIQLPPNIIPTLVVAVVMVFSFMVVNTIFIEWNANIELPGFMAGFEQWAKNLESSMEVLTSYLTDFESTQYFFLAIFIIAVIPGIGEELLFRGLLQNLLRRIFKNDHVAVWVAAIIFSAIHFQFYGFVPRMLLGALFGYLYLWTNNLLVPMVAHFLNNGFSLFALYVYKKGLTDIDVESTEALPTVYIIFFSALFAVSLFYFKNYLTISNSDERLDSRL
ncbi:MAG: CPBP family intramembrane metalloprotease [Cyclobacteriaceae bacterium]|nr:CPBP family intramembrane metalloprotease [Cyclobacteriaceae bacterium]